MGHPADPLDEANRIGGWYELALQVEGGDASPFAAVMDELARLAGVEQVAGGEVLRLPEGPRVVCVLGGFGADDGSVWVVLGLPLGSLTRVDPRVGGYPFSDDDGQEWRRPLDAWLASLAVRLFDVAPFSLALIGFDVSMEMTADELADGLPAEHDHVGIITVPDRPTYFPATG